jgi:maltose O-acetyltransferase
MTEPESNGNEGPAPDAAPVQRGRTLGGAFARLSRDRDLPLRMLAEKAVTYALGLVTARLWLRGVDRLGKAVRTTERPLVRNRGRIEIADWATLTSQRMPVELRTATGGTLTIGRRTFINYGSYLAAAGSVTVGERVHIGPRVVIADTDDWDADWDHGAATGSDAAGTAPRPIIIGDDVFIGARCTILPGVELGTGSVVGAGSVVRESVPDWTVVAGVPAVPISTLDPDRFVASSLR